MNIKIVFLFMIDEVSLSDVLVDVYILKDKMVICLEVLIHICVDIINTNIIYTAIDVI